jgi:hypothetical protein
MSMDVIVYTGPGEDDVPRDVVRVRVDPSVRRINNGAFVGRKKLTEVELCEGVVEIGDFAFADCNNSITYIVIPSSLRSINRGAFVASLRCPIRLHDGIDSIGQYAFDRCIFTNFRVPPLITVIINSMLSWCTSTFSVEISEDVTEIEHDAFSNCYCLRNVAFPPDAVIGDTVFYMATDRETAKLFCAQNILPAE